MIVDSHAHIFEKWSGACGLPSRALHWRYIQKIVTRPAAKVIRFSLNFWDRIRATEKASLCVPKT